MGVKVTAQKVVFLQSGTVRFGIASMQDDDGVERIFIETPYWEKIDQLGNPYFMALVQN
jgi:hypothetical protein